MALVASTLFSFNNNNNHCARSGCAVQGNTLEEKRKLMSFSYNIATNGGYT